MVTNEGCFFGTAQTQPGDRQEANNSHSGVMLKDGGLVLEGRAVGGVRRGKIRWSLLKEFASPVGIGEGDTATERIGSRGRTFRTVFAL